LLLRYYVIKTKL